MIVCFLSQMKEKPGMRQIATVLQQELSNRFDKVLNPSCALFDPVYVQATLLDPRFKIVLTPDQLEAAKVQLLHDVSLIIFLIPSVCVCVCIS